ncbi:MAG: S-methyl-5-thioribose-1-phosphate isomerase [Acidobacteriota bacterium]|nr:S-methyl-5-thioribose-1-phosphate isomerase [Acidobacteriota bacterium]
MRIDQRWYRTIWPSDDGVAVEIIDQTLLPHHFEIRRLSSLDDAADAIRTMKVRGAPLIGATAAYGICLAMGRDASDESLTRAEQTLAATRPTAVNLRWALAEMRTLLEPLTDVERARTAWARAATICDDDVEICRSIGEHGLALIRQASESKDGETVHVLTHCNAGWLATVDWGTALAPIYMAHDAGVAVHVWVDETRPRNQGASLTAFELGAHGVPHTLIVDNAGGHLMQKGLVDLCIVGTDRTSANGDVANKIGTYLKALAAHDNGVPFYVALPSTTIDWETTDGLTEIPIEERSPEEVTRVWGRTSDGATVDVAVTPESCPAFNPAFDVTPARLVTGLITERGVCAASWEGLSGQFPEQPGRESMT